MTKVERLEWVKSHIKRAGAAYQSALDVACKSGDDDDMDALRRAACKCDDLDELRVQVETSNDG